MYFKQNSVDVKNSRGSVHFTRLDHVPKKSLYIFRIRALLFIDESLLSQTFCFQYAADIHPIVLCEPSDVFGGALMCWSSIV